MTDTTTAAAGDTAAEPAAPSTGLLDGVTPETPPDRNAPDDSIPTRLADDPTAEAQAAEAAKRERPDWLAEKFWDPEKKEPRLEQMAKSYAELEKNFKIGRHKAPEGGKYDLTPFEGKVAADDPLMAKYTEWAGKYGLPQSAYEELVGQVIELAGGAQQEAEINAKAEREALGANADAIIGSMADWARGFVRSGVWSAEDFEEFKIMAGTAQGMKALMKVRESYEGRVPLQSTPPADLPSREELEQMVADPRYLSDVSFRNRVTAGFEALERHGLLGR